MKSAQLVYAIYPYMHKPQQLFAKTRVVPASTVADISSDSCRHPMRCLCKLDSCKTCVCMRQWRHFLILYYTS